MKKFYVNQLPIDPVLFKIVDEHKQSRNVMIYQSAKIFIRRPDGTVYSEGSAILINNPFHGVVYEFGSTSPFSIPGEYQIQIKLYGYDSADQCDFTDLIAIDVFDSLEGA